ncbi:MAG: hypothetical protein J7530_05525 [Novosphingobium sp.]|nr:hypothetical protein [Novosphingobium sp.]
MTYDNIMLRWNVDLANRSAKLGDVVVSFSEEESGSLTATLEGAGEIGFRRKLGTIQQAIEEFENTLARAEQVR